MVLRFARHLELADSEENLGAKLITQAASATVTSAGDGTTTSVVLANAICKGEDSVDFIKGIDKASKDVVDYLEKEKSEMTDDMIKHIAYISTNNDEKLGGVIAQAFIESGEDGIVEAKYFPNATEVSLDIKSGAFFEAGYTHQHFVTNERQRTCELKDPYILVSNATLNELAQIEHVLEAPVRERRPIIIIADCEKNFNEAFISNVTSGIIQGCIINPGARITTDGLRDLAELVGAIYFDNASGNSFDYLSSNYWGKALTATIGYGFSLFSIESNDHVQSRIDDLKDLLENGEDNMKDTYKSRLSMLNGKYVTIKIGAPTQAEAHEIKDRVDDAVFAVGAAQKHGYLSGGGVALRDASTRIKKQKGGKPFEDGYNFLLRALTTPYDTILENAGIKQEIMECCEGYDASNGKVVNMIDEGIIDPAFVTIQSVINATSSATALLSAKATLIIKEN